MAIICDYHIHTPLCGHADGTPQEYINRALTRGLKEIGFSDHMPLLAHHVPNIAMSLNELPNYHDMIEKARAEAAGQLTVRVGIEADFDPGYESRIADILNAYPYDYVIGSVHFIGPWGFDNPDEISGWDQADVAKVYRTYYDLVRKAAMTGLYDIIGHVDLVKKFGYRPAQDMTAEIETTAQVFRENNVAIEINTAGLRKPVHEIYPSLNDLKIYCAAGVPIAFGSDAHQPQEVGQDFDQALELALAAGYKEYILFKNRKRAKALPLR